MRIFKKKIFYILKNYLSKIYILPFRMIRRFFTCIIPGYIVYRELICKYGVGTKWLTCAWLGTGDYYICGCYLQSWLEKEGRPKYVFLAPKKGSESKVLALFPHVNGHICLLDGFPGYCEIKRLCTFVASDRLIDLHHQRPFLDIEGLNITNGYLQGYKGLNMVDFYLACGFQLPFNTKITLPIFEDFPNIDIFFSEHNLKNGKTAVLSPYSTGLSKFQIEIGWWEDIVFELLELGYSVCTNCFGNEKPIKNTIPVAIQYKNIVPFLNHAGLFIGIRSGLVDIISSANCKKIIIHTYQSKWWPDGMSVPYTGVVNMGLCDVALELVFSKNAEDVKNRVLEYLVGDNNESK